MTSITPWTQKMVQLIEEEEENKSPKTSKKHVNSLPSELVGRVFQSGLTVVDRFHCERVSPRWKWIVGAFGWSEQRKLNSEVVFEGATEEMERNFSHANLISLFHRVPGPNIVELDFRSLGPRLSFNLQIADSLSMFPNLRKLDFFGFDLNDFVDRLPSSLRNLEAVESISVETFRQLSVRCPNLERVPFNHVANVNLDIVNEFMGKFPRQKSLGLLFSDDLPNNATFEAIGQEKELVELELEFNADFDEENERAFDAMAEGCEKLRKICFFGVNRMTEQLLFHLAKMPSLTVVELGYSPAPFTDAVLKAIAKRGQLKRLAVQSNELTDEGIVYAIDQCKSLVSLDLFSCSRITVRSLKAAVAEVHRRYGMPPRVLPTGPDDKGIFFFGCWGTKVDWNRAHEMAAGNPWLEISDDYFSEDNRESLHL